MASNRTESEEEIGDEKESWNSLLNNEDADHSPEKNYKRTRNLVGFWLLGLCNNFSYVVMLSAAHDILIPSNTTALSHYHHYSNTSSLLFSNGSANGSGSVADGLECNPLSTGTVLLADILPGVFIKVIAAFYMKRISYNIRVAACIMFAFASFFMIAYSHILWVSLLGVVFASLSSGLGEITILSFSAHFDKDVVSTWSSGTGAAGVFGALSYAGLISAGMSPRNTVLVMNIVPFLFGLSFWSILEYPSYMRYNGSFQTLYSPIDAQGDEDTTKYMSFYEKLVLTKSLLKYIIPLFLVYFAEYFINQGLLELIYWNGIWLTPAEQYRWYQVDYQVGVLISRSSVNLFPIKNTCLMAFLQYVNLILLSLEAYYHYLPSVWIMLAIILFEGLLGGAVYVNSFYRISKEVAPEHKEFSMGVVSMADSFGITVAGVTALPTHNALCSYWWKKNR